MFNELGLSPKVVSAVEAAGYTKPTPIQAAAIPLALQKKDVLGLAQTGTGKTASFVLPMLSLLEKGRARARMPRTLILEPTRELAAQVEESFVKYGANHKLTVALLIGGVSFEEQNRKIDRGADVVIATPGRLLDHLERGKLLLQAVEIFVVDEADRMLDMGFIPDIERVCKILPAKRQSLFFSATMPKEIASLVDRFLTDPVRVEVSPPSSTAETVTQRFVRSGSTPKEKRDTLRRLIRGEKELANGIIFCNRKRDIGTLFRSLERHGFSVGALHGDMDQRTRMMTLDAFKNDKITLLVASDVAARGLDIPKVSHVFNYDVPHNAEDYVHRIGRTGRAGRSGAAFTIATPEDKKLVAAIESMLKRSMEWADDDAPASGDRGAQNRGASGERGGDRGSDRGSERGGERGRSGRGRGRGAPSAPPAEVAAAPAVAPAAAVEADEPRANNGAAPEPARTESPRYQRDRGGRDQGERDRGDRGGRRGRRGEGRDPEESRVPFKDTPYVPAFLLRPMSPRKGPLPAADDSAD
ncbi:DEAD/DEAH box helicase [Acuticoccus yangtzensis]|uniref:DEAD/DEAH box helicase n=1 Tax=Acuticoccus yangtzensis TaxID=1443441 RepID=UPI0009499461|nr:DEAD/DEAH box helicase [Acuticoccus yangtzensis]